MRFTPLQAAAVAAFVIGFGTSLTGAPPERFDHKVRNDFFAGFAGNNEAMDRAMKTAEEAIAANPSHAEALVWHGAGLYFQSSFAFRKGDSATGMELYKKGFAEMDKAVAIAPDHVGVRIPRGATLLAATAPQPVDDRVRGELKRALDDFQHTYDMQKDSLDQLGDHPLGQLLLGLGDVYSRLGEAEKARPYFELIETKLPGSEYARRAASWKANGKLSIKEQQCYGCHVSKK